MIKFICRLGDGKFRFELGKIVRVILPEFKEKIDGKPCIIFKSVDKDRVIVSAVTRSVGHPRTVGPTTKQFVTKCGLRSSHNRATSPIILKKGEIYLIKGLTYHPDDIISESLAEDSMNIANEIIKNDEYIYNKDGEIDGTISSMCRTDWDKSGINEHISDWDDEYSDDDYYSDIEDAGTSDDDWFGVYTINE